MTIIHLFGKTVVKEPPKRVVSAGFTEQDDLLAVGVVPIAVTNWFGDQPFAVWPWAQPKLGAAQPVVLNLDNGIAVDQIAGLKPDLIVAINAGVDADTYQKLSAIAPTIPQSDGDAFFEPWKDQATTIGQAVFQADQMKSLIDDVDRKFAEVGQKNPQWKGKKALLLQGRLRQGNVIATMAGWRTDFLNQMGLVVSDAIKPYAAGHVAVIPPRAQQRGARFRRCVDLVHRKSGGAAGVAGRPRDSGCGGDRPEAPPLHHQRPGRSHRVRIAAELSSGGRSAAPADRRHPGLNSRLALPLTASS